MHKNKMGKVPNLDTLPSPLSKCDPIYLALHVHTRAKQDAWLGVFGERIKISIKAPPIDNKANKYLIKFLAKSLKVKQNQITIISGEHSPKKLIRIKELPPQNLEFLKY